MSYLFLYLTKYACSSTKCAGTHWEICHKWPVMIPKLMFIFRNMLYKMYKQDHFHDVIILCCWYPNLLPTKFQLVLMSSCTIYDNIFSKMWWLSPHVWFTHTQPKVYTCWICWHVCKKSATMTVHVIHHINNVKNSL